MNRTILNSLAIFVCLLAIQKPQAQTFEKYQRQLDDINKKIAAAYGAHDEQALLGYYSSTITLMPEYHPTVYGKNAVSKYFKALFAGTKNNHFERKIIEVLQMGDHLSEIGLFTHTYHQQDGTAFAYQGKYMTIWKITGKKYSIVSDIWGSVTPIDGKQFAFIEKQSISHPQAPANALTKEVAARNALIANLVSQRKGEQHALEIFATDAMYLTYDTSILVGMEQIRPYFIEHEKPGPVSIDSVAIRASKMINLGKYVIEYGYYHVDVSWDNHKGGTTVTGKSTNLWRRDKNGKLMMFRQMVNHD